MITEVFYTCVVCGHKSNNDDDIKYCEAQEKKEIDLPTDTEIDFHFDGEEHHHGEIVGFSHYAKKTHEPVFTVIITGANDSLAGLKVPIRHGAINVIAQTKNESKKSAEEPAPALAV
jgi:hypothetical protein